MSSFTGLRRESLYKALSAEGNPEFATIMKVVSVLGLKLHATPASPYIHFIAIILYIQ